VIDDGGLIVGYVLHYLAADEANPSEHIGHGCIGVREDLVSGDADDLPTCRVRLSGFALVPASM